MLKNTLRRKAFWTLSATLIAAVLAAGCGSRSNSSSASTSPSTSTAAASSGSSTTAAPAAADLPTIADLAGPAAFESDPPTSSPPGAKGKSVWWVSCGMSIPDCSNPANAAKEAAAKLGITFHIADGKLNVGGGNLTAVRTALAAKPDLMIIHGIGCPGIKQGLVEAKAQGVKVMGVEALDCSDPPTGGQQLFTANMKYSEKAVSGLDYFRAWGKITADYIIAATKGKANYIANEGQEPLQKNVGIGFDAEMKAKCPGCKEIDKLKFVSADLIPNGPWVQNLRSTMTKDTGKFNVVQMPFDVNLLTDGAKAVKDSGSGAMLIGGSGSPASFGLLRQGTVTAITASHSNEWMGYGAMDNANRVLNDKPTVPQGVGFRPVDNDHNLPPAGSAYVSPIDFKAAYTKIWAAGQ